MNFTPYFTPSQVANAFQVSVSYPLTLSP
jgi:hypothetical protein